MPNKSNYGRSAARNLHAKIPDSGWIEACFVPLWNCRMLSKVMDSKGLKSDDDMNKVHTTYTYSVQYYSTTTCSYEVPCSTRYWTAFLLHLFVAQRKKAVVTTTDIFTSTHNGAQLWVRAMPPLVGLNLRLLPEPVRHLRL